MCIQTSQKAEPIAQSFRKGLLCAFALFAFAGALSLARPTQAAAATSNTINFQARLETSAGAIAPDGNYNVEFKLYNASSSSGSSQGSCTGDANCLWVETRTGANQVRVVNGYLTVNLGSVTSFPGTINWNQQLWITMNIGGTGATPSWDGEMNPRLQLTAVPYAFQAGTLSATSGSNVASLGFGTISANDSITVPDASGVVCLQNATACGFAPSTGGTGYIQLQGTTPGTAQIGNFNINGTGIAGSLQAGSLDTASAESLSIGSTNATSISLGNTTTNIATTINGTALIKPTSGHDSTTAFQVQNASGSGLLTADTSSMRVKIGAIGTATGQFYVSGSIPTAAVGSVSATGGNWGIYVSGNYAYVPDYNANVLRIIDISKPSSPLQIASPSTAGWPNGVYVQGHYAYVADYTGNELQIFDISNPSNPTSVGSVTNNGAANVYVQGRYAYVPDYNDNLLLIDDVSNPMHPIQVGSVSTDSAPNGVYVDGRYAYVADRNGPPLDIFDVSNPTAPVKKSSAGTGGSANVYVQGRYAYLANGGNNTLDIYDISNPSSPSLVSATATGTINWGNVYAQGHYAYVAETSANIVGIYDLTNVSSPSLVGSISGAGGQNVFVQGRYLYQANGQFNIYDVGGAYLQQLHAGGIETSTLQVDTNTTISGDENIQGGLTVGQNTELTGNVGIAGQVLLQNATNSTTAFQVQNAGGAAVLTVDTSGSVVTIGGALVVNAASGYAGDLINLEVNGTNLWQVDSKGHLISTGTSPSIAANATNTGSGSCSLSANSTDTKGVITLTTGSGTTSNGIMCVLTFANSYGTTPTIIVSSGLGNTASRQPYSANPSTTGFSVGFNNAPAASTGYTIDYFTIQ